MTVLRGTPKDCSIVTCQVKSSAILALLGTARLAVIAWVWGLVGHFVEGCTPLGQGYQWLLVIQDVSIYRDVPLLCAQFENGTMSFIESSALKCIFNAL